MDSSVGAEINIEGVGAVPVFSLLRLSQSLQGHHRFELRVPLNLRRSDNDILGFLSRNKGLASSKISIALKTFDDKDSLFSFSGIITGFGLSDDRTMASHLIVRGGSPTLLLDGLPKTRSFEEMSIGDIIGKVVQDYPSNLIRLEQGNLPYNGTLPFVVQYKETDFAFIRRLAAQAGGWLFYTNQTLFAGDVSARDTHTAYLGSHLSEVEVVFATSAVKNAGVAYDYLGNKVEKASYANPAVGKLSKDLLSVSEKLYGQEPASNYGSGLAEAAKVDEALKRQSAFGASALVKLTASCTTPAAVIGQKISIQSPRLDGASHELEQFTYGEYLVSLTEFELSGSGSFSGRIEALPADGPLPISDFDLVAPTPEWQPALVVDNEDPEKLGRVRVRFFWQEDYNKTSWIRQTMPYAGDDHGFAFVPEIGDQVLVGFEESDPSMPFVAGAYYAKDLVQTKLDTSQNGFRNIRTKAGNEILFCDKPGSEEITIRNSDGKTQIVISISGESHISIQADKIAIQGNEITLEGQESIALKAPKVTIDANSEFTTKAGKIELSAQSTAKFSGASKVEVSSSAEAVVSGGATLKLDGGAQTKLSGGAMVEIQGGLVKIN